MSPDCQSQYQRRRAQMACMGWLLCLMITGCSNRDRYVPVTGMVKYNGEPLKGAMVTFQPVAQSGMDAGGVGSTALTDDNGRFILMASTPNPQTGALVGKHLVRIALVPKQSNTPNEDDDAGTVMVKKTAGIPKLATQPIPVKYNEQSTLTFEVPREGSESANFDLEGPPLDAKK